MGGNPWDTWVNGGGDQDVAVNVRDMWIWIRNRPKLWFYFRVWFKNARKWDDLSKKQRRGFAGFALSLIVPSVESAWSGVKPTDNAILRIVHAIENIKE